MQFYMQQTFSQTIVDKFNGGLQMLIININKGMPNNSLSSLARMASGLEEGPFKEIFLSTYNHELYCFEVLFFYHSLSLKINISCINLCG